MLIARYSQGESITVLAESFPGVVYALERFPRVQNTHKFDDLADYVESLWLISLAMINGFLCHTLIRPITRQINELVDAAVASGQTNLDQSIETLKSAWRLIPEPKYEWPDVDRVLSNLAGAYRLKGDVDKAVEAYREAFVSRALRGFSSFSLIYEGIMVALVSILRNK